MIFIDALKQIINSSNKAEIIMLIVAMILAIQFLIKLWDWFIERFDIETKTTKREKYQINQIKKLTSDFEEIQDEMNKLLDGIKENKAIRRDLSSMKEELDEIKDFRSKSSLERKQFEISVSTALDGIKGDLLSAKIDDLRERILDFGNACKNREYNKEAYDNVLELYDRYEKIIHENNLTNGRTEMAMQFIRKKYNEYQEKGFPTY